MCDRSRVFCRLAVVLWYVVCTSLVLRGNNRSSITDFGARPNHAPAMQTGEAAATTCSSSKPWLGLVAQVVSSNLPCVASGTTLFATNEADHATFAADNVDYLLKLWYGYPASRVTPCLVASSCQTLAQSNRKPLPRMTMWRASDGAQATSRRT